MLGGGVGVILLLLSIVVSLSIGAAQLPISHIVGILAKQLPWIGSHIEVKWPQSSEQIINKVTNSSCSAWYSCWGSTLHSWRWIPRGSSQSARRSLLAWRIFRSFCRGCFSYLFRASIRLVRAMVDPDCGFRDRAYFPVLGLEAGDD